MSLLRAHKSVFEIVRDALLANTQTSHIKVSVGARFQGEQNPEVIIQQSSFDINDLNTADYGSFEISVLCYSNTYTEAANIADIVFTAVQSNNLYTLTESEPIEGTDPQEYNVSETIYHIKGLDLFLEHYDEDGYEANVLIRATEAQDTTTGVGGEPSTGGSPTPYYPQSDYRIQDLADVNVTSLAEGNILKYDFSEGEWVNAELPLLASNGLVSSSVNGFTLLSLADSQSFTSASTSGDLTVGGNLNFVGSQTKLIRPLNTGQAAGPLTIQSNGDLIVELDENADELDKAFIVKNGADTEVFKVEESGNVTVNQQYILPTSDGGTDYFLKTDGSGQLYFATLYGTSGNTGGAPPPAIDTISELLDTQISSLSDNQILRYDSGSSKWVNEDLTLAQSIGDLTDVDTTTVAPTDGQALVWDDANSQWEPGTIEGGVTSIVAGNNVTLSPTNGLGDVTINLDATSPVFKAAGFNSITTTVNYTNTTPANVQFSAVEFNVGSSITATSGSTTSFTVSEAGYYRVSAGISFYSTGQRITPALQIYIDGTAQEGTAVGYVRSSNGSNEASTTLDKILYCPNGNEVIELRAYDYSDVSGALNPIDGYFQIQKADEVGLVGPAGPSGPSGTLFATSVETSGRNLIASDSQKYIKHTGSAPATYTVQPQSAASWGTECEIMFEQGSAYQVTIAAGAGVTINSSETLLTAGQYAVVGLKKVAQDVWTLTGERETA